MKITKLLDNDFELLNEFGTFEKKIYVNSKNYEN